MNVRAPGSASIAYRARRHWNSLPARSRERILVYVAVVILTTFRSAMFVFHAPLDFDSDQAIVGLMAKDLIQGRAFPLFFYGQNYMLGVEAWFAAPVFLLAGVSVATLKLPLLIINLAAGLLLVRLLERECGLRPSLGLVAGAFFILAPPGTSSHLLETTGGNVEPLFYTLLFWVTRRRPVWFGVILGLGFLQREFTIYPVIAIIVMLIADRGWRKRDDWRLLARALRVAAEVWLVVQCLRPVASAAGPGTTIRAVSNLPSNNVIEMFRHMCFDARTMVGGFQRLATVHWAQLFGTAPLPAHAFGLESETSQGLTGSGFLLGVAMALMLWRIVLNARTQPEWWNRNRFAIYLVLVGAMSAGVYVLGRCGNDSALRYDLLSLFGAVGLTAWFLTIEHQPLIRRLVVAVVIAWAVLSAVGHGRIWVEYTGNPPFVTKMAIIRNLEARGIKYASSDYWIAYYITFATNERIIVTPETFVRIPDYERQVLEHRAEAIRISRTPCEGGKQIAEGVYFCAFE